LKIYLDACALNRLSDDLAQPRIAAEAEAIETVFQMLFLGKAKWLASVTLVFEIESTPSQEKRNDMLGLLSYADELQPITPWVKQRAEILQAIGYGAADALHLAHAEAMEVDVLLTTDDRFLRKASRGEGDPGVLVSNPVNWLRR
jgi:predicted nucleic acid-binding protein